MVTHLYESFAIASLSSSPDGGVILPIWETDEDGDPSGHKHIFPMGRDAAEQFYKQLGDLLGQKVDTANLQDMRKETAKHAVPGKRR